ncbi:hypothetical protein [Kineothrix alysoides]|uniref:hypothetical protein n=1 Tax=Kineothrix alysoides TaxID=1469948 RepID=UPI00104DBD35|nr:hypothetical protein [Kineothrix alysoides]
MKFLWSLLNRQTVYAAALTSRKAFVLREVVSNRSTATVFEMKNKQIVFDFRYYAAGRVCPAASL